MEKYQLSKDWIKANGDLIKYGYAIALDKKYDIKSAEDVMKILKIVDPENVTLENAKIFSAILQLVFRTVKKKFESIPEDRAETIN